MAMWKAARLIFFGTATHGLPLKGRLVRNAQAVNATIWDPKAEDPLEVEIPAGSQGLVIEESRQKLTIAYARQQGRRALRLESLAGSNEFRLLSITWITFKEQFEIEYWLDDKGQEVMTMTGAKAQPA